MLRRRGLRADPEGTARRADSVETSEFDSERKTLEKGNVSEESGIQRNSHDCARPPDLPPPRSWAEIDLSALRWNADRCREWAGGTCGVLAIVKADAYGHGLARVVSALSGRVDGFGVANVREAVVVRSVVGEDPMVLLLGPATPEEIPTVVANGFSGSVSLPEEVEAYAAAAARIGASAKLHAVVDTGMGRMGSPPAQFPALVDLIRGNPHCVLEGVDTHFPSADEDRDFTASQIEVFRTLLAAVRPEPGCHIHVGNSAGMILFQRSTPFATLVRPGLALYGVSPVSEGAAELKPVLSWKTRIALVRRIEAGTGVSYGRTFIAEKPMLVATLGVGYGDGYRRHLSGSGAAVLIAGRRCPLLGRVTMDQIVVDVSALSGPVEAGDEAVLIGRQGEAEITATELATKSGTIPWEMLTGITGRVERVYR